jgi:hypothetical protein
MDAVVMGSWSCLRDQDSRSRRPRKRRDSSCLPRLFRHSPGGSEVTQSAVSSLPLTQMIAITGFRCSVDAV